MQYFTQTFSKKSNFMKYTQNNSNHLFHVCIVYLRFYNACNFMICDLRSKRGMDHLTFWHEIIAIMLICFCQIQFVLQNNSLTLNSGFYRLRPANKFSDSQEQRRIEILHVVRISGDKTESFDKTKTCCRDMVLKFCLE